MRDKGTFIWDQRIEFQGAQTQVETQIVCDLQVKPGQFYEERERGNYMSRRKDEIFYVC